MLEDRPMANGNRYTRKQFRERVIFWNHVIVFLLGVLAVFIIWAVMGWTNYGVAWAIGMACGFGLIWISEARKRARFGEIDSQLRSDREAERQKQEMQMLFGHQSDH